MADACNVQSHSKNHCSEKFEVGIYFLNPRENIAYFSLVGNVELFDSHSNPIAVFPGNSVSNWTVALNTWNATRESEDAGRREDIEVRFRMAQNHAAQTKGNILT